jgi:hypothetical protein
MPDEKQHAWFLMMAVGITTLVIAGVLMQSVLSRRGFWILRERVTRKLSIHPGSTILVGPLKRLANRSLYLDLDTMVPKGALPRAKFLTLSIPTLAWVRYTVSLCGQSPKDEAELLRRIIYQPIYSTGDYRDEEPTPWKDIVLTAEEDWPTYTLKVRVDVLEGEPKPGIRTAPSVLTVAESTTVKFYLSLVAGAPLTDLTKAHVPIVTAAQVEVESHS